MKVLVCGGLGFAGRYVVYYLLRNGHYVTVMVRPSLPMSVRDRVFGLKLDNDLVSRDFSVSRDQFKNLSVVEGDLSKPDFGMNKVVFSQFQQNEFDEVYNMAANLRYEESFRDSVFQVNVEGTKQLLSLARKQNARYIHASTAYIADKNHLDFHPIKEEFCTAMEFQNVYIESKCQAELCIREYSQKWGLNYLIFRFPTLVGDSKTGYTNSICAFYEYLTAFEVLQNKAEKDETIRIPAVPNGRINLLPTDLVIKNMFKICTNPHRYKIFTLTDRHPLTPLEVSEIIGRLYTLKLKVVDSNGFIRSGTRTEKLLARLTSRNTGFAQKAYVFDCSNAERALGHPVAQGWDKSLVYFNMLKTGYEMHRMKLANHTLLAS